MRCPHSSRRATRSRTSVRAYTGFTARLSGQFVRSIPWTSSRYFLKPSYSTISPATADAATVSGDARYSRPGPERPL